MAKQHTSPPRLDTPVPPASSDVVALRPKPPAFPAISAVARPVIIEQDVIDYLVKAPLEQRWRILARVATATQDEQPAPTSTQPVPAATQAPTPKTVPPAAAAAPPPPPHRPQLELVDQTHEPTPSAPAVAQSAPAVTPTVPPAPPSVPRPGSAAPPRLAYSAPPPPPAEKPAVDPAEELFEVMHDLTLREDAASGARFCLDVALASVPSLAGLVHLRDPKTLELVVVHAQGPRADGLLHVRTAQNDALVARAARAGKPVVATYGAEPDAEKTACPRHAFFDPWSVVVVPVVTGGQLLGLLEIVDPIDGKPFDPQVQSALAYVADRLAKFLVEHPAG